MIPKYKTSRATQAARTDSGYRPSVRRSLKGRGRKKPARPRSPKSTNTELYEQRETEIMEDAGPVTQLVHAETTEDPADNINRETSSVPSVVSSGKDSKSKKGRKKASKTQKKKSSLRGPRKKRLAPLGRSDLEGIDEIDLIAPPVDPKRKNEMELLKEAKRLWLEFSADRGTSEFEAFHYGVFNGKNSKIIIATPVEELGSKKKKPQYFNVTTLQGEQVCEIRFTTGTFCKQNIKIHVTMQDESIGTVKQESNSLVVFEQTGQEIMRFTGVPKISICQRQGPDAFNCEVYLSERSYHHSVGVFGKNGQKSNQVMLGVASGFYFIAAKGTHEEIDVFHKVFILSAMHCPETTQGGFGIRLKYTESKVVDGCYLNEVVVILLHALASTIQ